MRNAALVLFLLAGSATLATAEQPAAPAAAPAQTAPGTSTPPADQTKDRPERIDAATDRGIEPNIELADGPIPGLRRLPGVQRGGSVLLPNQWSLRPAGDLIELGDFPVNMALHPTEPFAAILHAGWGTHEVVIVRTDKRGEVVCRVPIPQGFYGIAFSRSGDRVFASGGETESVHTFRFSGGLLSDAKPIQVVPSKERFVVSGLATSTDDATLYVCGPWGAKVAAVELADPSKVRLANLPADSYPYAVLPTADGKRLFVSLWGGSAVAVLNATTLATEATWTTPAHPTEMALSPDGGTLYVACANTNQAAAIDTATGTTRELITTSLYPSAPPGSTPNSLALSADGSVLLVANADNNNIAVFNVSEPGKSRSMGFIPAGWYTTSVRTRADGTIFYTAGKGMSSKPNRNGPNPEQAGPRTTREYIGGLFRGAMGTIKPLKPDVLTKYTAEAYLCSPLQKDAAVVARPREAGNPVPVKVGEASPIKHCIYIIKENRTYDQIFGDMPEGKGDPSLCLFGEKVTPNHHALAREFVLLDNFYVEAEVSADGHEWTMGAYASDFVEKTWPLNYRPSKPEHTKLAYPSEGTHAIAVPQNKYIWDRCKEAGISYYSFGEWIKNGKTPQDPGTAQTPTLEGHFDPGYRGYDLDYPDVKRAERFITRLAEFEAAGQMPRFTTLRIGNDHTAATRVGKGTPRAMVADNDLALGMIIEALSKSKFWASTAVFVIEDDAQNGPDHVDAHRAVALCISPYTRGRGVDSSMYSTTSMIRTMGLILGFEPLSQFDAAALPMYHSFRPTADLTAYKARPAQVDLTEKNTRLSWGADISETLDLAEADEVDDILLSRIVWHAVKGADVPMPPPVRAGFVFAPAKAHDGDDQKR